MDSLCLAGTVGPPEPPALATEEVTGVGLMGYKSEKWEG